MLTNRFHIGFNTINATEIFKNYETSIILILSKLTNDSKMDSIENGALTVFLNNSNNKNNNNIKCERLSPRINGDFHTERSRSATPSSYSGTSPQPANINDISGRNITSNILIGNETNGIGEISTTRNYSDFMRSLAAKYNNNTNDITKLPNIETNNLINSSRKECTIESARLKQCNSDQNISTNVAPLVSSLISRLQFSSQNVFPPLIDMSSTQALVTLARVAKEIEIQKILKAPQHLSDYSSTSSALKSLQQQKLKRSLKSSTFIENNNVIPLDLSSAQINKRSKLEFSPTSRSILENSNNNNNNMDDVLDEKCPQQQEVSLDSNNEIIKTNSNHCQAQSEEINSWTVEDVCDFVGSINICAEYVENFRDQCIDGLGLPLLTEGHLTNSLGMKLGPALKLRLLLAKKLGGPCPCVSCINQNTTPATSTLSSSSLKYLNNNNNINSKKKPQSRPSSTDSGS